jgi:hypothetical protein
MEVGRLLPSGYMQTEFGLDIRHMVEYNYGTI